MHAFSGVVKGFNCGEGEAESVMGVLVLLFAGGVILCSHFIGAIAAYGSTLLALPALVMVVKDLQTSVVALLLVSVAQSYHIMFYTVRNVDRRELVRILLWAGMGIPIGFTCAHVLPSKPLLAGLGCVLIAGGVSRLIPGSLEAPKPILRLLLFIGGIIHGAFACGGATIVVYAQHTFKTKEPFRATLCMVWVILNTVLAIIYFAKGMVTPRVWHIVLIGLPFILLGNMLAEHTAHRVDQQRFMQLVAVLLVIGGVFMIGRLL